MKRGEKVTVEVPVQLEGEAASGTLVTQDATTIEIEAEALSIPEGLTVSIEDAEEGTQILAGQVSLPPASLWSAIRRCSWSTSLPPRPKRISPRRGSGEEGEEPVAEAAAEGGEGEGESAEAE